MKEKMKRTLYNNVPGMPGIPAARIMTFENKDDSEAIMED